MSFILLGFSQEDNVRHFAFQRIAADGTRTGFTVHADLLLARKFNIKLQDLPLMCRQMLDSQPGPAEPAKLTFTADDMRIHLESATAASAANAAKRARHA
jgi:hypothetical protein